MAEKKNSTSNKIGESIKDAVGTHNIRRICAIVNHLRFYYGMKYSDIASMFERIAAIDEYEFESLMQECDELEATL